MSLVINQGNKKLKDKNYINILVNLKEPDRFIKIGCTISFLNKTLYPEYEIVSRFYKIKSFQYNIPLDYVNLFLKKLYPQDIVYKIIEFYLKDDVSFSSINEGNKSNTIKTKVKVKYSEKNRKYNTYIDNQSFSYKNKITDLLTRNITDNFENILNKKTKFDINDIFINKRNIDLCIVHKINSTKKAWGITKQINS